MTSNSKKIDKISCKNFVQNVMISKAVIAGLGIVFISFWVNRKVVNHSAAELKVWYGWVGSIVIRFIGIAASAVYLAIIRPAGESFEPAIMFMVTVLGIVLAGMVGDLILSLTRVDKIRKAGF